MDAGIHVEKEHNVAAHGMMDSGADDAVDFARCSIEVGISPPGSIEGREFALALLDRMYMQVRANLDE